MNKYLRPILKNKLFLRSNYDLDPNYVERPIKILQQKTQEINEKAFRGSNIYRDYPENYETWKTNYYGNGFFLFGLITSYILYYEYVQYIKYLTGRTELPSNVDLYK